ncbi:hypothetical protein [Streptomyces enissocaesilis]|uniref:Methyltransferase type 11 domain-containing protein n=1 Tax=Streptomyces enissocaesilis TaxID=332589 RepID=A0ABP6JSK5_9ACTN
MTAILWNSTSAPAGDRNLHLLGVSVPFPDEAFDRVVNIDLWRMLSAADMSRLVLEGFRLATEVALVWTSAVTAPVLDNLEYAAAMLRQAGRVDVEPDDGRGYAVLRCRRLV